MICNQTGVADITEVSYKALIGDDTTIVKASCKILQFKIRIPPNYHGDVAITLKNSGYGTDDHVTWCGANVVDSGDSVACVIPEGISVTTTQLNEKDWNEYIISRTSPRLRAMFYAK